MSPMRDNEIDQLFNNALGAVEAEPSKKVWESISNEIHPDKSRSKQKPFAWIMVAASILLIGGLGLLLVKPKIESTSQMKVSKRHSMPKTNARKIVPAKSIVKEELVLAVNTNKPKAEKQKKLTASVNKPVSAAVTNVVQETVIIEKSIPVYAQTREEIIAERDLESSKLSLDQTINTTAVTLPVIEQPVKKENQSQHHKIHSVGDLVNLVVGKVDKRNDKVIEFKDDEENGSVVSGFNLGFFKIKTNNK